MSFRLVTLAYYLPSLRWGERIETQSTSHSSDEWQQISPHFGGGSGLKLRLIRLTAKRRGDLPSLRWGERIETSTIST